MMSASVTIFACCAGLRYVTPPTSSPSVTFSVRAARAASMVLPSNIQFSGGPCTAIWCRWSITEMALNPDRSAVVAISTSFSNSCSGPTPGKLRFARWRSSVIGARMAARYNHRGTVCWWRG